MRRKPREVPEDSSTEVEWTEADVVDLRCKGVPDHLPVPVGFGAATTGGHKGQIVHVHKAGDRVDDPEPGSLRWALAHPGPTWIVFEKDLTVELAGPLPVGSDTTVDGRGRAIQITGHETTSGLMVEHVSNVVLESLTLYGFGDLAADPEQNNPHDAIALKGATRVWVDHCDLSRASDKALGISGGSREVTVTWCRFHDQSQTFQIGNMTNAMADVDQTVTAAWNWYDHCNYRMPVVSYGKCHFLNNYLDEWGTYAVRSQRIAQTYLEANVFRAGEDPSATLISPGGDASNDSGSLTDDRDGYLYDVANLYLGKCKKRSTGPGHMFNPKDAYAYLAEPATEELASRIESGAGVC